MKLIRKVFFTALFVAIGIYTYNTHAASFLKKYSPQTKKQVDNVLGIANKAVRKEASRSAALIDIFAFRQASKPIVEQFNKLPVEKQNEIKKQICR